MSSGGNGSARRAKRMSTSRCQKRAHAMLTTAGYWWVKTDSHEHNHYHNDAHQMVIVPSSPRSESAELDKVERKIRTHDKEREAMNTQTKVSLVDQLVATGDSFLTNHSDQSRHAQMARLNALVKWMQRACEKFGPLPGAHLLAACERMGYSDGQVRKAKVMAHLASYKPGGHGTGWFTALPHQVPEEYKARVQKSQELGVNVEAPESVPVIEAPIVTEPLNGSVLKPLPKAEMTDQQAAAMMLLESLGVEIPSTEGIRAALAVSIEEVEHALENLRHTYSSLA